MKRQRGPRNPLETLQLALFVAQAVAAAVVFAAVIAVLS